MEFTVGVQSVVLSPPHTARLLWTQSLMEGELHTLPMQQHLRLFRH